MEDWIDRFPGLQSLAPDLRQMLVSRSQIVRVPSGQIIFGPGKSPENLLLLLTGTVRVHQIAECGREIVLYRVEAGESCVMTAACLLAHDDYTAEGVAESEVQAVAIPRTIFDELVVRSSAFRELVFAAFARRITDLFRVVEEVAFGRIDVRLAQRLVALAHDRQDLPMTHQQLASELGTAREVVSRQLREFQHRGWITQGRGAIRIANAEALTALAAN